MTITYQEERLSAEEYIDFLKRTDLGSQYPKERFQERIEKLVQNASISLTARSEEGKIVGVLFGLTDFVIGFISPIWVWIETIPARESAPGSSKRRMNWPAAKRILPSISWPTKKPFPSIKSWA